MANRMKDIANLFGLELGEHFHITKKSCKGTTYKFTPEGVLFYSNESRVWYESVGALAGILTGDTDVIKLPWKPVIGETYYISYIYNDNLYEQYKWNGGTYDEKQYEKGLIFRTKEEAIALSMEMLAVAKEKHNNE